MEFDNLARALDAKRITYAWDEPMSRHTTFKIGGPARMAVYPETIDGLIDAVAACVGSDVAYRVIGNGSNLLVDDAGIDAAVIITTGIQAPLGETDGCLCAPAGESLTALCHRAQALGLGGLAFAFGIPGSVGGAVYMNAGAYGGEMKDVVASVTAYDPDVGEVCELSCDQLDFGYRHSCFMERPLIILEARFRLKREDTEHIKAQMADFMARRREKQPLEWPSAGSTFKRPEGAYAAALIDQCGLKGMRVGGAMVSDKHAGFVINVGGATCGDVTALMDEVGRIVKDKTGFILEPEVRVFR